MKDDFKIKFDTHTHTLASTHAYSTVMEMAAEAARQGLEAIAVTDHAPALPDAPHEWHFHNLKNIPREICGVKILYGIELNILDLNGTIDMPDDILQRLDVVNASIHGPAYKDNEATDHTSAYEAVVTNPLIDIICHSGSPKYMYDYDKIIELAKENHKLIEINNHSFYVRESSIPNCRTIARKCMEKGVGIVVSSDAHICFDLGNYELALDMLREINFPQKLIMNRSLKAFEEFISVRKKLFSWKMGSK